MRCCRIRGIDVSENNGTIDWQAVLDEGIEFVIIRLGWGNRNLDENFYQNLQAAQEAGLKIGVYYYSYALDIDGAKNEAEFTVEVLQECGLQPDMGVWFDMEDADDWKKNHGMPDPQTITNMCMDYINVLNAAGFYCGVYSCQDWLDNMMDRSQFPEYVPIWNAEINGTDSIQGAMWQYTFTLDIGGNEFDGDIYYD